MEWSPLVGTKYYVLKIGGDDVHDDLVIGARTSLEIHYHALVMKKADEKPEETEMRVYLSAMDDERVLAKAACEKLSKRLLDLVSLYGWQLHYTCHYVSLDLLSDNKSFLLY